MRESPITELPVASPCKTLVLIDYVFSKWAEIFCIDLRLNNFCGR